MSVPRARLPLFTAVISLFAIAAFHPAAASFLQYDRAAINTGELWRVLTGHVTHWSIDHLGWDLAAFATLGVLNERRDRRRFLLCLLLSATTISAGVWLFRPDLAFYRGLSGVDSALFVLLVTSVLRTSVLNRDYLLTFATAISLAAAAAKTAWELTTGAAVFVNAANFEPLPLAHVIGGVAGLLAALLPPNVTFSLPLQPKERAS